MRTGGASALAARIRMEMIMLSHAFTAARRASGMTLILIGSLALGVKECTDGLLAERESSGDAPGSPALSVSDSSLTAP